MSSTLYYGLKAFRLPQAEHPDFYVLFAQHAASNVRDDQGRLCPSWSAQAVGSKADILQDAFESCALLESGVARWPEKPDLSAEDGYLLVERALKRAKVDPHGWQPAVMLHPGDPAPETSLIESGAVFLEKAPWHSDALEVAHFERTADWLGYLSSLSRVAPWRVARLNTDS